MCDIYIFSGLLSYILAPTIWVKAVTNRARLREMLVVDQLVVLLVLRTEYVGGNGRGGGQAFFLFLFSFLSFVRGKGRGEGMGFVHVEIIS